MAPEGATLTTEIIVPQKVESLEALWEIFTEYVEKLWEQFMSVFEEKLLQPWKAQGWKVARTKERRCGLMDGNQTRKVQFRYRVLQKGGQSIRPLLAHLNLEKRRRYTLQARLHGCVEAISCGTFRQAAHLTGISRMSLWNWVQQWAQELPTRLVKSYSGSCERLHCESDRFYLAIRGKTNKQPVHLGIAYTGKKTIGSNGNRPYRRLENKRWILELGDLFPARFEGEIHSRIARDTIAFYSSDQGEPADKRAKNVVFTETFIDFFHLARAKNKREDFPEEEWEKAQSYRGYFGSCESNVKVAKNRLARRTWSLNGIRHFLRVMSCVRNEFEPLPFYFSNHLMDPPRNGDQWIHKVSLPLSVQDKLFHAKSDEWTKNRAIDSGHVS